MLPSDRFEVASHVPASWPTPTPAPPSFTAPRFGGDPECRRATCIRRRLPSDRTGYCERHVEAILGPPPTVEEVRRYLQALVDAGARRADITRAGNLGTHTVRRIMWGERQRVTRPTAQAILAIDPAEVISAIPKWRASRRARSLMAAGHSTEEVMAAGGLSGGRLARLLVDPYAGTVTRSTWESVNKAWETLGGEPVRLQRSSWMREREWPVPAEWDNIDDPEEERFRNVVVAPASTLPGSYLLRTVVEERGLPFAARLSGYTKNWIRGTLAVPHEPRRSNDLDMAFSRCSAEYGRISYGRSVAAKEVRDEGVGDGAPSAAAAA